MVCADQQQIGLQRLQHGEDAISRRAPAQMQLRAIESGRLQALLQLPVTVLLVSRFVQYMQHTDPAAQLPA